MNAPTAIRQNLDNEIDEAIVPGPAPNEDAVAQYVAQRQVGPGRNTEVNA